MAFYKCQKGSNISSVLEENSWETIREVGAAGTGANYWAIGDTKTITLNGYIGLQPYNNFSAKVFIIEFNYRGDNGIYFQGFKTDEENPVDISLIPYAWRSSVETDGSKVHNMNHWGNYVYSGWKGCDARYDILGSTNIAPDGYGDADYNGRKGYDATSAAKTNPVANTLMAALPSDLRNVLAPWTVYADGKTGVSSIANAQTASVDYLPLLAEYEVAGERRCANPYEYFYQAQMAYYANGNSKIKHPYNFKSGYATWAFRSPYANNRFCAAQTNGDCLGSGAAACTGMAPAFRVA